MVFYTTAWPLLQESFDTIYDSKMSQLQIGIKVGFIIDGNLRYLIAVYDTKKLDNKKSHAPKAIKINPNFRKRIGLDFTWKEIEFVG